MWDMNLSEYGTSDARYGTTAYNATILAGSEDAVGLIQETWSTGENELVVTPTKVYIDDGTTRTDVTGSLTLTAGGTDDRIRKAFINDKVVVTNGKDETWYKDGDFTAPSNATALTGMQWTTCEDLITHQGLLLAFAPTESGTKYGTRIRWCDINSNTYVPDITTWPSVNRFEVYEGGPPIIGAVDNFGKCLVFKGDEVGLIEIIEREGDYLVVRLSDGRVFRIESKKKTFNYILPETSLFEIRETYCLPFFCVQQNIMKKFCGELIEDTKAFFGLLFLNLFR